MTLKAVRQPPVDPAIRNPRIRDSSMNVRSVALTVLAVLAIVLVLQYAQAMIIPIVLGVLISYALEPFVATLTRWHLPRPLAAAIVLRRDLGRGRLAPLQAFAAGDPPSSSSCRTGARRLRQMIERERPTTATAIQQVQKAATELEKAATVAAPPQAAPQASSASRWSRRRSTSATTLMWGSLGIAAAAGQIVLILFLVVLSPGVRRPLPPQAREDRRAVADEEAGDARDPEGDRSPDRAVPGRAAVHERRSSRSLTWIALARARRRAGGDSRACSPASSTRFRTSVP